MSSVPLAAQRRARDAARRRDGPRLGAWALVAAGALLAAGTLVLLVIIERHGVPGGERPNAAHVTVRVIAGGCLLVVGGLMLAHLPRHPLSWIFGAAGIGTELAVAANQYAVCSHYVRALPAAEWVGWLSEWVSFPIVLVPGVRCCCSPTGAFRAGAGAWRCGAG